MSTGDNALDTSLHNPVTAAASPATAILNPEAAGLAVSLLKEFPQSLGQHPEYLRAKLHFILQMMSLLRDSKARTQWLVDAWRHDDANPMRYTFTQSLITFNESSMLPIFLAIPMAIQLTYFPFEGEWTWERLVDMVGRHVLSKNQKRALYYGLGFLIYGYELQATGSGANDHVKNMLRYISPPIQKNRDKVNSHPPSTVKKSKKRLRVAIGLLLDATEPRLEKIEMMPTDNLITVTTSLQGPRNVRPCIPQCSSLNDNVTNDMLLSSFDVHHSLPKEMNQSIDSDDTCDDASIDFELLDFDTSFFDDW